MISACLSIPIAGAGNFPAPATRFSLRRDTSSAHHGEVDSADERDLRASLNGDESAYERIVKRYEQKVASRMSRFSRDRGDIEELTCEVFVEAWLSLPSFRFEAPLDHWLARIGTRVGYRFWKQKRRDRENRVRLESWDAPLSDDKGRIDPGRAAELLDEVMGRLKPADRLVLTLRYLEGLSVDQTAQRAGWSRTRVKVQAHRARKRLRKILEAMGLGSLEQLSEVSS